MLVQSKLQLRRMPESEAIHAWLAPRRFAARRPRPHPKTAANLPMGKNDTDLRDLRDQLQGPPFGQKGG